MIASEPTTEPGSSPAGADPDPAPRGHGPVTTLRGAGVDEATLDQMMVVNPRDILDRSDGS